MSPALCGDEPALLHELCPSAFLGIGANRILQYEAVLKRAQTSMDLVVLDDGFQHWKIHKDLEIVALTSKRFGEVLFRDWKNSVRNARFVVWTKGKEPPYTGDVPLVKVKYRLVPPISQQSLWFVTGIADSESAYDLALKSGYHLIRHISLPDHYDYTPESVRGLLTQALENQCKIALTGKDWMKWKNLGVSKSDVVVLEPEIVFENGLDIWSQALWGR